MFTFSMFLFPQEQCELPLEVLGFAYLFTAAQRQQVQAKRDDAEKRRLEKELNEERKRTWISLKRLSGGKEKEQLKEKKDKKDKKDKEDKKGTTAKTGEKKKIDKKAKKDKKDKKGNKKGKKDKKGTKAR